MEIVAGINAEALAAFAKAEQVDDVKLPKKIALYESGLAMYPTDPDVLAKLSFGLARAFFIGGAMRLATHRLNEAFAATSHPSEEMIALRSQLNRTDMSQISSQYPKDMEDIERFQRITYSVEKLWKLDVPTQEIPLTQIERHLTINYWATPGEHHNLSPKDVLDHPEEHGHEYTRIQATNFDYPIDVCMWEGKLMLLDGLHRLAKAHLMQMSSMKVRMVPLELLQSISTIFDGSNETRGWLVYV